MTGRRRAVLAGIAALMAPAALPSSAAAVPSDYLTISQVYTGGGNGAPYAADFVELHNKTASPVHVFGWAVQHTYPTGTPSSHIWFVTQLGDGWIPAHGYYLVRLGNDLDPATLPAPDATGTVPLNVSDGKVALTPRPEPLSGACPTAVQDLVEYGL